MASLPARYVASAKRKLGTAAKAVEKQSYLGKLYNQLKDPGGKDAKLTKLQNETHARYVGQVKKKSKEDFKGQGPGYKPQGLDRYT